jgi:antirestriction protein
MLTKTNNSISTSAFFYIDGIPTKGCWIDLMDIDGWESVEEKLLDLFPSAQIDEILCSDIEGIGKCFYASNCDGFSMDQWLEFKDSLEATHLDIEAIEDYIENIGSSDIDISNIEDCYYGQYDDFDSFVYQFVDDCDILHGMDESLKCYFDYAAYGRDLSYDFFIGSNGHVFRNC